MPGGLASTALALRGVAFDDQPSATENATVDDLRSAYVALCGFPRTGTTFLQKAINLALGDESACFKNHDPLAVGRYADAGLTTLVTLRDPLATIVSWSLYHGDLPSPELLSARLATYVAWHREIRRRLDSPWVVVIDFDEFSARPSAVLEHVLDFASDAEVSERTVSEHVRVCNEDSRLPMRHGNVPDPRRERLKEPYVTAAQQPRVRRVLERARHEHAAIQDRTFRLPD